VVGVFSGTRPSGGYGIMVDRVSDADAVRTVSITHTSPGADCMVTAALTSPYQMIVLPYSEKQLSRVEREAVVPCP